MGSIFCFFFCFDASPDRPCNATLLSVYNTLRSRNMHFNSLE